MTIKDNNQNQGLSKIIIIHGDSKKKNTWEYRQQTSHIWTPEKQPNKCHKIHVQTLMYTLKAQDVRITFRVYLLLLCT